jgi:hypothetical protein
VGLLARPGCASVGSLSYVEAVRRLLTLSTQNAFARLTEPDGFWNSAVARIYLPEVFGRSGGAIERLLVSDAFRERLQHLLNNVAEKGARRAAPVVADAVPPLRIARLSFASIIRMASATAYLRDAMGERLIEEMFPVLGDALNVIDDPLIRNGISIVAGADIGAVARSLAYQADDSIWRQIGHEEAAIRENPESSNDPVLIAALKAL